MKRILLMLFFLSALSYYAFAQLSTCAYYDGYWGNWSSSGILEVSGSYNGFVIYDKLVSNHPSDYFFKFEIDNADEILLKFISLLFLSLIYVFLKVFCKSSNII